MRYGLIVMVAAAFSAGCGTYRSNGDGEYRGMGEFKAPSDYEPGGGAAVYSDDQLRSAGKTGERQNYIPRGDFKLYWPVNTVKINRGFRPASDRNHDGLDLGGKRDTPILAAHEGMVIYAGKGFRGYGKMVLLEFNNEWATLYAHLNTISVREGQIVKPGDPLGGMGATGRATGVHLHFELMRNKLPVDPMKWLTSGSQITLDSGQWFFNILKPGGREYAVK
jgi:murein DD-endopeptidase MepM/ murein hydrolase activator NlpD